MPSPFPNFSGNWHERCEMWFDGSSPVKELLWIASRMDWVSSMQPHPGFPFRAAMDPVKNAVLSACQLSLARRGGRD